MQCQQNCKTTAGALGNGRAKAKQLHCIDFKCEQFLVTYSYIKQTMPKRKLFLNKS